MGFRVQVRDQRYSAADLIFEEGCVHDSDILIRELTNITAEEDGLAGFDHLHRSEINLNPFVP